MSPSDQSHRIASYNEIEPRGPLNPITTYPDKPFRPDVIYSFLFELRGIDPKKRRRSSFYGFSMQININNLVH